MGDRERRAEPSPIAAARVYVETPEPALPDALLDPLYKLVPLGR